MKPERPTVADVGEKRLIRELIAPRAGVPVRGVGVGDDAAVVEIPPGEDLVVSTDKIPEDLLALRFGLMDATEHGRYLAEVNLSDIGAMGARPAGLLLTLALPNDFPLAYVDEFMSGFAERGMSCGAPVVGGDTGWASVPMFSATALGTVAKGKALLRSGARPGDLLAVSGEIGGFGAALAYFATADARERSLPAEDERRLRERLVTPHARIDLGGELLASGSCSACMDVTDGLRQSLVELGAASNVAFAVSAEDLPIAPVARRVADLLGVDVMELVFGIGLELELLTTVRPGPNGLPPALSSSLYVFGRAVSGPSSFLEGRNGERLPIPGTGWQHFGAAALDRVRAGLSRDEG